MNLIKKFIFAYFFTFTISCVASEPKSEISVNIAALEFTGVIQKNLHGAFDYMMIDIANAAEVNQNYHVVSPARGARMLFTNKVDCLIPSSDYPPYFVGHDVIHSESFAQVYYIAFTLPENEVISNKEQLNGKVIGVIRDADTWNYEKRFNIDGVTYVKVSNLESLVEMLYHGRIDVAIHDFGDFTAMTKHLKRPQPNYDSNSPMAVDKLIITCHNNANNRAYLQAISPHLQEIIRTDKIHYYLKKATID